MSDREFGWAAILRRVAAKELTLAQATPLLGVSYRHAKRLARKYRTGGRTALVHGNAGRPSNRATPEATRATVLALIRAHYGGTAPRGSGQRFGPTLAAEHLWTDHGVRVSVTTLTRWMCADALWGAVQRLRPHRQRRERHAQFGALVQLDGSVHDWFEGRGPRACAMTMIDDATGRTLIHFSAQETTWAAAGILAAWITAYGVPLALYTDWKDVYLRAPTLEELATNVAPRTQFGRMCEKLGITLIGASSPQAKGRVERGHGTHQDRLIKKLRLCGIHTVAAANSYLAQTYLPAHNARFAIAPASPVDSHRVRDRRRWPDADVFCLETPRLVGNDYVVQYHRRGLQLDRRLRGRLAPKSQVLVRETVTGAVHIVQVLGGGRDHRERALPWTEAPARARTQRLQPALPLRDPTAAPGSNSAPVRPEPRLVHQRAWLAGLQARDGTAQPPTVLVTVIPGPRNGNGPHASDSLTPTPTTGPF
jgi:hypothetical protein